MITTGTVAGGKLADTVVVAGGGDVELVVLSLPTVVDPPEHAADIAAMTAATASVLGSRMSASIVSTTYNRCRLPSDKTGPSRISLGCVTLPPRSATMCNVKLQSAHRLSAAHVVAAIAALAVIAAACSASGPDAAPAATAVPATTAGAADSPAVDVMFSVNVQDFAHPEESESVVRQVLDIHESLGVPVDIYLTDDIAIDFSEMAPDLLERLATSDVASVSYHVRPPRPYGSQNDWLGLSSMTSADLANTILDYETHRVDPATGAVTADPGGYAEVARLIGSPPVGASSASGNRTIDATAHEVFASLGAVATAAHQRDTALGASLDGLVLRPENVEIRLWEHPGEDGSDLLDAAVREAAASGSDPAFVGLKIHDNNFFATESAWVTVYAAGRRRPDWDPTLTADLISDADREAIWSTYQSTVEAVSGRDDVTGLNMADVVAGS